MKTTVYLCRNNQYYAKYIESLTPYKALCKYILWMLNDTVQYDLPALPASFQNCTITVSEVSDAVVDERAVQKFNVIIERKSAQWGYSAGLKVTPLFPNNRQGSEAPTAYHVEYYYNI